MVVLRHLYEDLGGVDAFNLSPNWFASSNLAIDQGPIVVMIEESSLKPALGLVHRLRGDPLGLRRLGFDSPALDNAVAT